MHLTPEIVEASYTFLLALPPFNRWRLPEPDDVVFHVSAGKVAGWYTYELRTRPKVHHIGASARRISTSDSLNKTNGHEMIHLYQEITRTTTPNTEHNAAFDRLARRVCAIQCWDLQEFLR